MVDSNEDADWVIFVPFLAQPPSSVDWSRLVVVDIGDNQNTSFVVDDGRRCALYFKRSWAQRENGTSSETTKHPMWYRPFVFSALGSYYSTRGMMPHRERPLALACLLRPHTSIHFDESRSRVLTWVLRALVDWGLMGDAMVGQFSDSQLMHHDQGYYDILGHARVVVTANPSGWEGDHRTWEALASGALVFMDRTSTPHTHPLIHGIHAVLYDPHNEAAFRAALYHFLVGEGSRPGGEAEGVAARGAAFVMRHHLAVNRAEYILDELEQESAVRLRAVKPVLL